MRKKYFVIREFKDVSTCSDDFHLRVFRMTSEWSFVDELEAEDPLGKEEDPLDEEEDPLDEE